MPRSMIRVHGLKAGEDLEGDGHHRLGGEPAGDLQLLLERLPPDVIHDDVRVVLVGAGPRRGTCPRVADPHHVGVLGA